MKTAQDFQPEESDWLIEDWFPMGQKGMDVGPETSYKSVFGCWLTVCIAAGHPVFGHEVTRGPTMIIDEESPSGIVDKWLDRFAKGIGCKLSDLPITKMLYTGFRLGQPKKLFALLKEIERVKPIFVRMDSLTSMLPFGNSQFGENKLDTGISIRDTLNAIIRKSGRPCSVLLAVHSPKYIGGLSAKERLEHSMVMTVRGHGSIVGEGCDTGYKLRSIDDKGKFEISIATRRYAIPANKTLHIRIDESSYSIGPATLKYTIVDNPLASDSAVFLYPLFETKDSNGDPKLYTQKEILTVCALKPKSFCDEGLSELLRNKVVVKGLNPFTYLLNTRKNGIDPEYLDYIKKNSS